MGPGLRYSPNLPHATTRLCTSSRAPCLNVPPLCTSAFWGINCCKHLQVTARIPRTDMCGGVCPVACVCTRVRETLLLQVALCAPPYFSVSSFMSFAPCTTGLAMPIPCWGMGTHEIYTTCCLHECVGLFTHTCANSGYGCTCLWKHLCAMLSAVPLCVPVRLLAGKCPQV